MVMVDELQAFFVERTQMKKEVSKNTRGSHWLLLYWTGARELAILPRWDKACKKYQKPEMTLLNLTVSVGSGSSIVSLPFAKR